MPVALLVGLIIVVVLVAAVIAFIAVNKQRLNRTVGAMGNNPPLTPQMQEYARALAERFPRNTITPSRLDGYTLLRVEGQRSAIVFDRPLDKRRADSMPGWMLIDLESAALIDGTTVLPYIDRVLSKTVRTSARARD